MKISIYNKKLEAIAYRGNIKIYIFLFAWCGEGKLNLILSHNYQYTTVIRRDVNNWPSPFFHLIYGTGFVSLHPHSTHGGETSLGTQNISKAKHNI